MPCVLSTPTRNRSRSTINAQYAVSPSVMHRMETRSIARAKAVHPPPLSTPRVVRTYGRNKPRKPNTPPSTPLPRQNDPSSECRISGIFSLPSPPIVQNHNDDNAEEINSVPIPATVPLIINEGTNIVDVNMEALRMTADGLKTACRCDICYLLMQRPFTLQCGHSSCGPCLRLHFSSLLTPRLSEINCKIPSTAAEMERVVQLLWSSGYVPRTIFSYICPSCRKPVRAPPFDHIGFKVLIGTIRAALKDHEEFLKDDMGWLDETDDIGTGYFNGYFLDSK